MKELKRRKHHSAEFKKQAVELLLTGRSFRELAAELGVSATALIKWKRDYLLEQSNQPEDVENLSALKMREELRFLRKENEKLKLHQEILKKAMSILSDPPPTSML